MHHPETVCRFPVAGQPRGGFSSACALTGKKPMALPSRSYGGVCLGEQPYTAVLGLFIIMIMIMIQGRRPRLVEAREALQRPFPSSSPDDAPGGDSPCRCVRCTQCRRGRDRPSSLSDSVLPIFACKCKLLFEDTTETQRGRQPSSRIGGGRKGAL